MIVTKNRGRPVEFDKNKIIKVARTLFAELGFAGASTRLIAQKAGCNVAMIGYYFKNKEGLLDIILTLYFQEATKVFSHFDLSTVDSSLEFFEFSDRDIRQFCKALYEFAVYSYSNREIHQIVIRDTMSGGKLMLNALAKNDYGVVPVIHKRLKYFIGQKKLPNDLDINVVGLNLIAPITCVCISGQIATKIHGFEKIDESFFRRLCVNQVKILFSDYKKL